MIPHIVDAVEVEVGEFDCRGASITARREQHLEGVDRRLVPLEGAIDEVRSELAAVNVRLDLLPGREGQRLHEGMQSPSTPPATPAG